MNLTVFGVRTFPRALRFGVRLLAAAPPLAFGIVTLAVFWNDLFKGVVYYGGDTSAFYYPLTIWYAAQLHSGQLPLWLPHIFGGYPLFADGEVGMLYPLQVVAFGLLPADLAFAWLRPLHFWLAGLFTYWLGRLIGLHRFGALLAGLTFGYGSFLVSHLQHENIIRSAIWLPLALGLLEMALRRTGRRRLFWLLACGVVVGVQMLGVHIQPVLLSMVALGAYALVGPLAGIPPSPHPIRHLAGRLAALVVVTATGLGLAAVQLLPLYQLWERSVRPGLAGYEFSTSYSVPPMELIGLLLPYLFRPDQTSYWGLWTPIESTIYLGVAPLLLALVAVAYLRSRAVLFFGLLAGASLVLALGDYLPVKLYSLISSLPGFSYLRVPARFSMLFVLAGAMLAGFGADWLASRAFNWRRRHSPAPRVRRLMALAAAFALGAFALGALFLLLRDWLSQDPGGTRRVIEAYYLSLRRGEWPLSSSTVYAGVLRSIDLANPRTQGGLVLMIAASALLLSRGMRLVPRRAWQAGVLALVGLDLVTFAHGFNPQKPIGALNSTHPAVQFLLERNGLHRVFVEPALYGQFNPNQFARWGIDFAGGYSSLEPVRATEYWWSIVRQDNVLLDLFNVRYVVAPRATSGLLSFDGTRYHSADRLLRGATGNPSGSETFHFEPWRTESISVVAAGEGLSDVPHGEPVAEITLGGPDGQRRVMLRAGIEVGDRTAPQLGPSAPGRSPDPTIVWVGPAIQKPNELSVLYGARLSLDQPLLADSLAFRRIGRPGTLDVHGVGLYGEDDGAVRSLMPTDRGKYRLVFQDQDVNIFENTAVFPRAFLVGAARPADSTQSPSVIEQLLREPFDPRQAIFIEPSFLTPLPTPREPHPRAFGDGREWPAPEVGTAEVLAYDSRHVAVRTDSREPGYLVLADRYDDSWRAAIDGQQAPLFRANGMFRAVPVPAGAHEIVFSYEPMAVYSGAAISLASLLLLLAGLWVLRPRKSPPLPLPQSWGRGLETPPSPSSSGHPL